MEPIKISIKLGPLEVQFEGSENFAESSLVALVEQLASVDVPDVVVEEVKIRGTELGGTVGSNSTPISTKLSTTDFAVRMGSKSGTGLVMAAAAYIHHTKSIDEFRRTDLLAEMKLAKAFYKSSFGGNLSKSLDVLVKTGRLQNPKLDTYTLPYAEIESTSMLM